MKNVIRTTDMSKKEYNKPKMRMVKLQHEAHLLSGSDRCCKNPNSDTDRPSGSSKAKVWHWMVD